MNERIHRMINRVNISKYPLCIEKYKIANETLKGTEGMPQFFDIKATGIL